MSLARLPSVLLRSAVLVLSAFSYAAEAASPNRVWVSRDGSDVPGCFTVNNPCRTFQWAHDTVAAGGEIDVRDSGGYGALTITKSLTITNDGSGTATIQAANGNAITINADTGDSVYLRGLSIDGGTTGSNGIVFNSGGSLSVTHCTIRHFGLAAHANIGNGILVQPVVGTISLTVTNSVVSDNGYVGIYVVVPWGAPDFTGVIDGVVASNNAYGLAINSFSSAGGTSSFTIRNNILNNNSFDGFYVDSGGDTLSVVAASNIAAGNLNAGFNFYDTAQIAIRENTITSNLIGIANNTILDSVTTYGSNTLFNNQTSIIGANPLAASPL